MTSSKTPGRNGGSKTTKSAKKVYRSMAEIRRAYYPNAEKERAAARGAGRARNGLVGIDPKAGGAL